ncbi:unnamed protein product [Mycena citricolor]|uniref:NACHT domain-containing protein n=1 Tax=Mycena citricolor TaxID=2018698 RepID=A0AAD2H952_9AGAR|nr:unnamed protein product [Mycena citricolor]
MTETQSLLSASPTLPGTAPDDVWKRLLDDAITAYEEKTGKKLDELPFAHDVENCTTLDDFFVALDKHQKAFGDFRSQGERIRAILNPIVSLTQAVIDPAAEAAATFVPGGKGIFVVVAAFLQASKRVSANYDALELVLLRFQPCLIRLEMYLGLDSFDQRRALRDVFLKILVLMIKIFGLLTTELKSIHKLKRGRCWVRQKRIKDWVGQLLQAGDTRDALNELDELTKQEGLAAVIESVRAAERAQIVAEQARSAALAAKVTALEARFAAEGAQIAANSAEDAAEGAKVAALGALVSAGGAEVAAEGAQGAAEGAQFAAVGAEVAAEGAQSAAIGAKVAAEGAQSAAVGAKVAAEGARSAATGAALAASGAEEVGKRTESLARIVHNNIVGDHIKTWLKLYDTGIRLDNLRNDKHEGTCEWFFDKKFREWLQTPNGLYWVHGKPGAGKSVSMSALVDRLKQDNHIFAFFFVTYRDVQSQTMHNIQSSLVYQLATKMESCYKILEVAYNNRGASLSAEQGTVSECLMEMLKTSQQRVILVIDGLDEYPNPERMKSLLPFLEELHRRKTPNLRLLLASRPEHDIESCLKPLATHLLDLQDKKEIREDDIASFVHAQVEKHCSRWSIATREKAEKALNEKADGMFLWVSLQIDRLLECDPDVIEEELANLPSDVKGTYDRIMDRLRANRSSFHRSRRLLDSVAVHENTLDESLAAAIAMVDLDWVDTDGMPQPPDPFDAHDVIRRRGSSFLQIDKNSEVRFVHFTAKEYVVGLANFDENKARATLFTAYTTALLLKLVDPRDRWDWQDLTGRVREADVERLVSRLFDPPDALWPQIQDALELSFAGSKTAIEYEAETGRSSAGFAAVFDSRLNWAIKCHFPKKAAALLLEMGDEKSHSRPGQVLIRAVREALTQEDPTEYYVQKNSWAGWYSGVLHFTVKAGEKIGIVGRTGAGKTSPLQCWFRVVRLQSGEVDIDGRSIPGNPQNSRTDAEMLSVLQRAWLLPRPGELSDPTVEVKLSLNSTIGDEGSNYSPSEEQLLAPCRVLVKNGLVIILDEAPSIVNVKTDPKLQRTIKRSFARLPLLCIAHWLNKIGAL